MAEEKKKTVGTCETCEFFDYDEEWEEYVCMISLDEDEMIDFLGRKITSVNKRTIHKATFACICRCFFRLELKNTAETVE